MAVSVSELTDEYLFYVGELFPGDYAKQRDWLFDQYKTRLGLGDGEVTQMSFDGSMTQTQFRGATPEDHRMALKNAIEQVKAIIDGELANSIKKPFGFRFNSPPYNELESPSSTQ